MTVDFSLLISLTALIAVAALVHQVRGLAPRIAALRTALDSAPATRELRYSIREVIVLRQGNVVALPLRASRSAPRLAGAVTLDQAA